MFKRFLLTAGSLLAMTTLSSNAQAGNPADTLYLDLSSGGRVAIELLPDRAPAHVERIKKLTKEGFYNGITFHRVIDGFMAQTGDPTGTGTGGSKEADLPAEFTDYAYKRGTVGMARTADPNSANSQFFICFTDTGCGFLTGQYTVFGQVTEGMEFVDKIAKGEPPATPDKIVKAALASDEASAPSASTQIAPAPGLTPSATAPAAGEAPTASTPETVTPKEKAAQ